VTLTFVIPAYQAEATLRYAVASVLGQAGAEPRAVIVDDGSTDGTPAIADDLAARHPRVSVVHQENRGLPAAYNAGVHAASGELVAFLDADDLLMPDYAVALGGLLAERPDLAFAFPDAWMFESADNRFWRRSTLAGRPVPKPFPASAAETFESLLEDNFVYGGAIARREALLEVGGYDESLTASEDWDLWLRLLQRGHNAGYLPRRLAIYRRAAGQISTDWHRMAESQEIVRRRFGLEGSIQQPAAQGGVVGGLLPLVPRPIRQARKLRRRYPREVVDALRRYGLDDPWGCPPR
jgi:GT2 family glycosyltransferase